MKKIFIITLLLIFTILNVGSPQRKINYGTAFNLYKSKQYERAYTEFKQLLETQNDSIVADYTLYYLARCAMLTDKYDEAIIYFERLMKEYSTSLLYAYSQQYNALSKFILDNFNTKNFNDSKTQTWIKKFVLTSALPMAIENGNVKEALAMSEILFKEHSSIEGALYYHQRLKDGDIKTDELSEIYKLATIFNTAAYYDNALLYYEILTDNKNYAEEVLYRKSLIHSRKRERTKAIELYNTYLNNKNYNKYRNEISFMIGEDNYSLRNYSASTGHFENYVKAYPQKSNYLLRAYRRLVVNHLRNNRMDLAKPYIDTMYSKYKNETMTDISLRNYMRHAFLHSNKDEALQSIDRIKTMYTTAWRTGYGLSWGRWTHLKFNDTNKALEEVQKTLLYSKNPHHIQEAYTLATDDMKNLVSYSNSIYFEEAKNHYSNGNMQAAYERLNRVQFNDAIINLKETEFLSSVRALAKTIMLESEFVKDYYAGKKESEIASNLSEYTKKTSAL